MCPLCLGARPESCRVCRAREDESAVLRHQQAVEHAAIEMATRTGLPLVDCRNEVEREMLEAAKLRLQRALDGRRVAS